MPKESHFLELSPIPVGFYNLSKYHHLGTKRHESVLTFHIQTMTLLIILFGLVCVFVVLWISLRALYILGK